VDSLLTDDQAMKKFGNDQIKMKMFALRKTKNNFNVSNTIQKMCIHLFEFFFCLKLTCNNYVFNYFEEVKYEGESMF
jgi:hypothetical protein